MSSFCYWDGLLPGWPTFWSYTSCFKVLKGKFPIELLVLSLLVLPWSIFKGVESATELGADLFFYQTRSRTLCSISQSLVDMIWASVCKNLTLTNYFCTIGETWKYVFLLRCSEGSGQEQHDCSFLFHLVENVLSRVLKNSSLIGTSENGVEAEVV